jgi:hypothetical protein
MGLDMYFYAKVNAYAWDESKATVDKVLEAFPFIPSKTVDSVNVSVTLGYWRKANAIHNWFVKNVQEGTDDCGEYYVSRNKVVELLDVVNKVLDNRDLAATLLPPASGFFFGSTEMDAYYWGDVEHTKTVLENALKALDNDKDCRVTCYYRSSW